MNKKVIHNALPGGGLALAKNKHNGIITTQPMGLPAKIQDAIQGKERVDFRALWASGGAKERGTHQKRWEAIVPQLLEAQALIEKDLRRVLRLLNEHDLGAAFPRVSDEKFGLAPLMVPTLSKGGGYFHSEFTRGETPSFVFQVHLDQPDPVQVFAEVSPHTGWLNKLSVTHSAVGDKTEAVWVKRSKLRQLLLEHLNREKYDPSLGLSVLESFLWAPGVGSSSMPTGTKSHKWAFGERLSMEKEEVKRAWIVGGQAATSK